MLGFAQRYDARDVLVDMNLPIHFLMCAPDYFDVDYAINPWMIGNIHHSSRDLAIQQWQCLHQLLSKSANIEMMVPQPDWPDMVFTANAGLVVDKTVVLSRFLHPERQGEEFFYRQWFIDQGYTLHDLPKDLPFEGAGDALLDREGRWLWAGYGFRSELDAHPYLADWLDVEVLSLRLMDERFYHLDTCFCPLINGYLLYYPPAFDAYSNRLISQRIPESKRIVVSEPDAVNFACNAINIENIVILNPISSDLKAKLCTVGFEVVETPLTEFIKAGGAAKCLTLRLTEPIQVKLNPQAAIESQTILLEGHLLDSGLLNRVLDLIVAGGGSFQVLEFDLGEQRQSISTAQVKVSAPSREIMNKIMSQAIALGAIQPPQEICDVTLEAVIQEGVAPKNFYVTTIYPTEVRVNGEWVRVQGQRMDAVIIVSATENNPVATCSLLRDLKVGDHVVVDTAGIRTIRKSTLREQRGTADEFSFMGAGVSSERRVELVVEQIAWELRQIRDRSGKVAVVAGPVVIHTGGGEHLSWLIRQGYVQALLGGNAIAVHDIEQALLGTSLGIDMQQGVSVHGGHRHHMKAINVIRGCGSIANAVEQGVLTTGVMYECIQRKVPFCLAGSIRDDGPLPDTQMDLIEAQQEYKQLIDHADLILMLSSMLHSIGVGNMTPAGVKLVCVDINPAVVTKLSDRGSIESVGVVTDVGLFLSLLIQQLRALDQR